MDKRSLMAITLITIVVLTWLFYSSYHTQHESLEEGKKQKKTDSLLIKDDLEADSLTKNQDLDERTEGILSRGGALVKTDSLKMIEEYGEFSEFADSYQEIISVETDLVKAKLSRKGGALLEWELKNYKQWNGYPTQLIRSNDADKKGQLYMTFVTKGAKKIDTRDLYFDFNHGGNYNYKVSGDNSLSLTARIEIEEDKYIEKKYTFYGNEYIVNTEVRINNLEEIFTSRGYNYVWSGGLKYQEKSSVDESSEAEAMISMNDDIQDLNADDDEPVEDAGTGIIDYAGIKIKYFGAAIIPMPYKSFDGTVDLYGEMQKVRDEGVVESYTMSFRIPYEGGNDTKEFQVYIGPLDYDIVSDYNLTKMVYLGWGFIRYIGEYLILPLFLFIHGFIPNWGITIIVFSILMKILLYPLSIQQMRSAQKMKLVAPEMEKIREKYKDDQKEQQKATMNLYSEYGINPAGGCLPLLLQMPILFALWSVLRTQIDLRQADFIWWITDLSLPDVLVTLPFSLLGIKFISGLALLMGITMFLQQKLTITDPRQKAMVYMMPIMFVLIFSNLPSGLNLYYFMFNLLSIIQQVYINKFSKKRPTLADLKRSPKKEGWLQKKMREAQDMAEQQGRSVPGKAGKSYQKKLGGQQTQRKKKKR
jgi:YidC/Oxa1 family membrane protein insertase